MKKLSLLICAAALCACESLMPEKIDIIQLGIVPDYIVVPGTAGEDGVKLISDRDYSFEVVDGADWLSPGIAQTDTLSFSFSANEGFRRSGRIRVSAGSRTDELLVKQQGIYAERIQLSQNTLTAPAEGRSVELRIYSNLPSDFFSVSASSDKAIGRLTMEDYVLRFEVNPTTNRDKRTYTVTVSYIDGWGETVSDQVSITQEAFD